MALESPVLVGSTLPRVSTPVVGDPSRGALAIEFAEGLGVDLMGWQRWLLDAACRTDESGRWCNRTVLTLVGRQNGKTLLTACRILAGLWHFGERLAIASAQSRDVALEAFNTALELAEEGGLPIMKVHRTTGREEMVIEAPHGPARYKVVSATSGGGRGLSADLVVVDELREHKTFGPYAALDKTRRARPNSQFWAISTEGDATAVVLDELQRQGREAAESGQPGPLAYFAWSAAPELAPADPRAWAQANPALGSTLSPETFAAELTSDPVEVFAQEVLCRRTAVTVAWLPAEGWVGCEEARATVPDSAVGEVAFALDAEADLSHVAVAVAWPRPDGRVHVEAVATFDGATATVDAERALRGLVGRWRPRRLAVTARGPVEPLAGRVAAGAQVEVMAVSGADTDRAARGFYEAVVGRRLVHPPDAVLAGQVAAVAGAEPGLMVRRRSPGVVTDAAVAAVLAHWAATGTPAPPPATWVAY